MSAGFGTAVDPEMMNEAMKRAEDELLWRYEALIPRNVGPDGMTYGSQPMDRGSRIEAFLWRVSTGSLDILQGVSPPVFKRYVDEFIDDVSKSPMYAQNPQIDRLRRQLQAQTVVTEGVM